MPKASLSRLITAEGSTLRTMWSLTQLVVGAIAFAGCHLVTFLFAIADDADTGAFDFILRPLEALVQSVRNIACAPLAGQYSDRRFNGRHNVDRRDRRLALRATVGLGFQTAAPTEPDGRRHVASSKGGGESARTWKEPLATSQDKRATPTVSAKTARAKPRLPNRVIRPTASFWVIRSDKMKKSSRSLLGTAFRRKLVYACTVSPKLSDEEGAGLLQMLQDSQSPRPYAATSVKRSGSCQSIPVA